MLDQLTQNKFARLALTAGLCLTTVFVNQTNCNATQLTKTPSLDGSQLALKIKRSDVLDGGQLALKIKRADVLDGGQLVLKIKRADVLDGGQLALKIKRADVLDGGAGDDLIDNAPVPEQIQVDLFFGRNIGGVEAGCTTPGCEKP